MVEGLLGSQAGWESTDRLFISVRGLDGLDDTEDTVVTVVVVVVDVAVDVVGERAAEKRVCRSSPGGSLGEESLGLGLDSLLPACRWWAWRRSEDDPLSSELLLGADPEDWSRKRLESETSAT